MKPEPEYLVISDDEEDDEAAFQAQIHHATEASKQGRARAKPSQEPDPEPRPSNASSAEPGATPASSFLAERAKLEQERLARLKRLRPDTDDHPTSISKPKDENDEDDEIEIVEVRGAKRQRISSSSLGSHGANASVSVYSDGASGSGSSAAVASSRASVCLASDNVKLFWDGELRQTANKYVDRAKDTRPVFRLTEILSPVSSIIPLLCV